jgi:hypothetical protein
VKGSRQVSKNSFVRFDLRVSRQFADKEGAPARIALRVTRIMSGSRMKKGKYVDLLR